MILLLFPVGPIEPLLIVVSDAERIFQWRVDHSSIVSIESDAGQTMASSIHPTELPSIGEYCNSIGEMNILVDEDL